MRVQLRKTLLLRRESFEALNPFRPCSVKPLLKGIGEVWRGLSEILTCMGFNPSQSTSIPFNFVVTEQALRVRLEMPLVSATL